MSKTKNCCATTRKRNVCKTKQRQGDTTNEENLVENLLNLTSTLKNTHKKCRPDSLTLAFDVSVEPVEKHNPRQNALKWQKKAREPLMPKYRPYNYRQTEMIAVNYEDQLRPGTFEHAIHYLIEEELDLDCFNGRYKNDKEGRPAYNPAILLKIILYAYSKGITSSREIEHSCHYHIIFQSLACSETPHFTTIAHFISTLNQEVEDLFEQILLICDSQGLLGNELFAIDGCKMSSNAAKEWSGTFDELKQKRRKLSKLIRYHTKQHRAQDKKENDSDDNNDRRKKTIDTLKKNRHKINEFLKSEEPRMGKGRRPKEVKSNLTDNESAKMTTGKGTIQGYNGVAAVDAKNQVIIDAQAFGEGQEHHTLTIKRSAVCAQQEKKCGYMRKKKTLMEIISCIFRVELANAEPVI